VLMAQRYEVRIGMVELFWGLLWRTGFSGLVFGAVLGAVFGTAMLPHPARDTLASVVRSLGPSLAQLRARPGGCSAVCPSLPLPEAFTSLYSLTPATILRRPGRCAG
jgi:hypothetical protein